MTAAPQAPKKLPLVPILFGVVAIALVAVVVLTFDSGEAVSEFGSPTITGDALAPLPDGAADPAVGQVIPEVVGADFAGNPVSIDVGDGNAKILLFVAHWCGFCQAEVPVVQEWIDAGRLPEGVDLITIATGISASRPNYPPSAWLEEEGWTSPVIVDNEASELGATFGLPAYPYWVFTDADGVVLARTTGELPVSSLDNAAATLAATVGG